MCELIGLVCIYVFVCAGGDGGWWGFLMSEYSQEEEMFISHYTDNVLQKQVKSLPGA